MDLSKYISVTGKSGLFRIVAQGRQALIVESLETGKRTPVHTSVRVSSLDEISVFTTGDDVPLGEVLAKLNELEKSGSKIDPSLDTDALFAKLGEALPDHDRERIYPSDIRKMFLWYAELSKAGVFKEEAKETKKAAKKEEEGAAKPKKKSGAATAEKAKRVKADGDTKKSAPKKQSTAKPKAATLRKGSQRGG